MTFKQAKEELIQNEKFRYLFPPKLYYNYFAGDWNILNRPAMGSQ